LILSSFAKVNLFLKVLNKRQDNFHNLITLFERIDLCDKIVLKMRKDALIKVTCDDPAVPLDESNLCYRSAALLQDKFGVKKGVDIRIFKKIPVGAGLGGGSSNASTALVGLNRLWKLGISRQRLCRLGAQIGSDVPFFIHDVPFALGLGRGEKIKPLASLKKAKLWHLLAVPRIHVSTPTIYRKFDALKRQKKVRAGLTAPAEGVKILLLSIRKNDLSRIGENLFNSLEPITIRLCSEVRSVKYKLAKLTPEKPILMSGSGPAVFCILNSRREAVFLGRRLAWEKPSLRVFVTGTKLNS